MTLEEKIRVLVIEDDLDILESMRITLERNGLMVTTRTHGKNAVETVLTEHPHIVVMDVMMPPPDGIAVCRTLKAHPSIKHIPVILLSARSQQADVDAGFNAGCNRYLTKPYQNEDLIAAIRGLTQS